VIYISLCSDSRDVEEYIYISKLFFNIQTTTAMNTIAKNCVNVGSHVTKSEMNELTAAYKQERWAANSDRLGKSDSLSVWFTVEELEGFLEDVKANGGNGVRMHFGVFPQNYRRPEVAGMQTLVLVANRSKDGSLENAKELFIDKAGRPEILALDGPVLCPPWCGTGLGKNGTLVVRNSGGMEVI
jgi:hypothetical protein